MTRYGYIGLGQMGSAMVERLLSTGAVLVVHDLDAPAVEAAVALGAIRAESSADVAAVSDVVSICVPAAAHVDAVMRGPRGIVDGAHDGLTVLIHSTVHADTMRAAHDAAASWNVAVHDACVAGGTAAACAGELAIFVGGAADMTAEARALLDIYGSHVVEAGPVGSGAALKIAFNVMTYAQQAAARAAFGIVAGAGASPDALVDAWRHIGQLGTLTERYLPMISIPPEHMVGEFRSSMKTLAHIGEKDLQLAIDMGSNPEALTAVIASLRDAMTTVLGVSTGEGADDG